MTQKTDDEVIDQLIDELPPEDEQDIDPENPDAEIEGEAPKVEAEEPEQESEAELFDVTIPGFEAESEEPKNEGNWVKELRKRQRELAKENRELKQRLESANVKDERAVVVGEKPTLAGCEFDDEKFERELLSWNERKLKYETQQREKQQAEEQAQKAFQEKLAKYDAERKSIPVDDYEDAEEAVQGALNQTQLGILVKNAPEAAKLVYAIGKNDKALQHLASIKDPDTYAVELGRIIERMKSTAPKKTIPAPERVIRGSAGKTPASTSANLDKLKQEAERTGDYSRYFEAKRKAG